MLLKLEGAESSWLSVLFTKDPPWNYEDKGKAVLAGKGFKGHPVLTFMSPSLPTRKLRFKENDYRTVIKSRTLALAFSVVAVFCLFVFRSNSGLHIPEASALLRPDLECVGLFLHF